MGVLIDTRIWIDVEQGRIGRGDVADIPGLDLLPVEPPAEPTTGPRPKS